LVGHGGVTVDEHQHERPIMSAIEMVPTDQASLEAVLSSSSTQILLGVRHKVKRADWGQPNRKYQRTVRVMTSGGKRYLAKAELGALHLPRHAQRAGLAA
jgi:hypothetical protein